MQRTNPTTPPHLPISPSSPQHPTYLLPFTSLPPPSKTDHSLFWCLDSRDWLPCQLIHLIHSCYPSRQTAFLFNLQQPALNNFTVQLKPVAARRSTPTNLHYSLPPDESRRRDRCLPARHFFLSAGSHLAALCDDENRGQKPVHHLCCTHPSSQLRVHCSLTSEPF